VLDVDFAATGSAKVCYQSFVGRGLTRDKLPSGDGTLLGVIIDQASETSNESNDSAELLALIDRLPARQAAVLRLRRLEGLGCREASR
jgi:DNA-directed RNA polymerase specialized sigma24 family protein